jgi:hypothetical protein
MRNFSMRDNHKLRIKRELFRLRARTDQQRLLPPARLQPRRLVRSKSELLIAEKLFGLGINYQYERIVEGTTRKAAPRFFLC